jgi:hypothetical protein
MKYLMFIFLQILFIQNIFSQSIDSTVVDTVGFPRWFVVEGDTMGIIFSTKQAQKIDNDLEMKSLLEKKGYACDSTLAKYIKIVDDNRAFISMLDLQIKNLNDLVIEKNSAINNLESRVNNLNLDLIYSNQQMLRKNEIIQNKDLQIGTLKVQRAWAIGGGISALLGGILIGVLLIP